MRKLFLLFFFVIAIQQLNAAVFIVTSNADSGIGTLRTAILSANGNGTATTDYIYFNLPGSTATDVRIALQTELPAFTANIIVDATTQPFAALNHPNIKIELTKANTTFFHGFRLEHANNIEIYGISFNGFNSAPAAPITDQKAAIYLNGASFITVGAPSKQNCFTANDVGIFSPAITPKSDNSNISISSNIFGLATDGLTPLPNQSGIDISYFKDGIIGGDLTSEGNIFTSNVKNGISLPSANGLIKIANNVIGLDQTLVNAIPSPTAIGIFISAETAVPQISNNIICKQGKGIVLNGTVNGFIVAANKIGTALTGTETFGNEVGIHIYHCTKGTIGGNAITAANQIAYNKTGTVIENSYPIAILKNSFYCNVNGVSFEDMPSGAIVPCKISVISANGASGKYLPNATIELFYTDSCPDCEGKTWFATITADASGNWSYTGPINGIITSMGTNTDGATTSFSGPEIDDFEHVPVPSLCGQSTGAILKMKTFDSNVFEWYNENDVLVGNALELRNVPAGKYYLKTGQGGACNMISTLIEVQTAPVIINDLAKEIKDATCSNSNGSITKITVNNNLKRIWYDQEDNHQVSTTDDLLNVPKGRYYFIAGTGSCAVRSQTYLVADKADFYQMLNAVVSKSTCGSSNGKIVIKGSPSSSVFTFKWFDEDGNVVGNSETLMNVPVGNYHLFAYSNSGCETDVGIFTVTEDRLPIIDYTSMQKYLSCDGKFVSATGIVINGTTGPYHYIWKDRNGNEVANQLNPTGILPGEYALQVVDSNDCLVDGGFVDFTGLKNSAITVPNSITPNGDGINDVWQIDGVQNYMNADFSIYTRDGNRVFYSRGYPKPFDGIFNGKPLPVGVYYYVIDLKTDCPKLTGSLTILR